jgi:hypothetical protein
MSDERQKRDSQGRFKKKGLSLPSFDSPLSTPPKLAEPEKEKKKSVLDKFKPKKLVIPEYNPVIESKKLAEAMTEPKGWGAKKKQAALRLEVENTFGEIDWDPDTKFPRVELTEEDTTTISTYAGPTSLEKLKSYDGMSGRAYRFVKKIDDDISITKIAEKVTLRFITLENSLSLSVDNPNRNKEHVLLLVGDYEVRLSTSEVIFIPIN